MSRPGAVSARYALFWGNIGLLNGICPLFSGLPPLPIAAMSPSGWLPYSVSVAFFDTTSSNSMYCVIPPINTGVSGLSRYLPAVYTVSNQSLYVPPDTAILFNML